MKEDEFAWGLEAEEDVVWDPIERVLTLSSFFQPNLHDLFLSSLQPATQQTAEEKQNSSGHIYAS